MKKVLSVFVLIMSIVLTAYGARKNPPSSAPFEIVPAISSGDSPAPEVATTLPDNGTL